MIGSWSWPQSIVYISITAAITVAVVMGKMAPEGLLFVAGLMGQSPLSVTKSGI